MVNSFFISCVVAVLFDSCSCWVISEINTKMIAQNVVGDVDDVQEAALLKKVSFIYPGTKWCGAGNIADNYDDLGSEKEADMCCREHDNCPDIIIGGETKYNLTNKVFYTRLSCACDETFYGCLNAANTQTAKIIGNIYFNALQTQCFRQDYPIKKCIKKGGWLKTKCLQYSYDTNGEKLYQWFDVQDF